MSGQSFEDYLQRFIEINGPPVFKRRPWYNPLNDSIDFLTVDEAYCAEPVDEWFTLKKSVIDGRPIGFQIMNAKKFIEFVFPTATLTPKKAKNRLMRLLKKKQAAAGCSICWAPFESLEEALDHSKVAHPRAAVVAFR